MNRPKIKLEKTITDKSIEILTLLLIFSSVVILGIYYAQLPEQLPINFNWPSKDKDGYGAKNLLWVSPLICGLIAIGIHKLIHYPWVYNYPTDIDDKNAAYNYRQATQMLRLLNLLIGLLCLSLTLTSVLDGLGIAHRLDTYLEPMFPILFIGIPMLYLIKIIIYNNAITNKKSE